MEVTNLRNVSRQGHDLEIVGSNPTVATNMVAVVQLVRTSDCGSEGRRFDPDRSPKNGTMTERLGGGLQNLLDWFDSS